MLQMHSASLPGKSDPATYKVIIDLLGEWQGEQKRILDCPSGPGFLSASLSAMDFTVVSCDIDQSTFISSDLTYAVADMQRGLPFKDGSFDYLICVEGIEHIDDHSNFWGDVARVVKPGGRVIVTTPNIRNVLSRFLYFFTGYYLQFSEKNMKMGHINPIDYYHLERMVKSYGFIVELLVMNRDVTYSSIIARLALIIRNTMRWLYGALVTLRLRGGGGMLRQYASNLSAERLDILDRSKNLVVVLRKRDE